MADITYSSSSSVVSVVDHFLLATEGDLVRNRKVYGTAQDLGGSLTRESVRTVATPNIVATAYSSELTGDSSSSSPSSSCSKV
jgi:hypothetical protein